MQSATRTQFKQPTCPKCKNNHDNEGVLCSFCVAKELEKNRKRPPVPPNFWVKCLIEREGDTHLNLGNVAYVFRRNERGDSVCEIINQGHYYQILKTPSLYIPYVPDTVETIEEKGKDIKDKKPAAFSKEQIDLIEAMHATNSKVTEIAAILSEGLAEPIPWQRVSKYIKDNIKE